MSNNQQNWTEMANLVLNPRSKDVKLETYSSLIIDVLFEEKDKQFNFDDILEGIHNKFSVCV